MGDVLKERALGAEAQVHGFWLHRCHDGQGRGLDKADAHGEDEYWPSPLLGYTMQANWDKEIAAHLQGKDYHAGQLRAVPHGQRTSRERRW